jgi:hypothetical protein
MILLKTEAKLPLVQSDYLIPTLQQSAMRTLQRLPELSASRRRGTAQEIPVLIIFGLLGGVDTTMAGSEVV